jgi:histidyl-tRNA synthetase
LLVSGVSDMTRGNFPSDAKAESAMAKPKSGVVEAPSNARPAARLPKGMRDIGPDEMRGLERMLATIRQVYESYGFEPLDTPAFEYTDALGKFLPDQDRPNAGVFSFKDEDEAWVSLRYDLTAPLARHVAENFDKLPKPYRRYASGFVFRNEKPGPGRYRQFMQFDADTVGTDNVAADAEICMLAADTLERLGILRGQYLVRVNNRKLLDGVLEGAGLAGEEKAQQKLIVLRAIDKLDKFGVDGVRQLLGVGRHDESGDFTRGAELSGSQAERILSFVSIDASAGNSATLERLRETFGDTEAGRVGLEELAGIARLVEASGFGADRVRIDPAVVRGLEYYTGPVFEAELTFEARNEFGEVARFGSVGGGGRYDDLVARFTGQKVPATGFSIGVSRLYAALQHLDRVEQGAASGPVVVLVMDKAELGTYQRFTRVLREAGIRAEMYLGTSGMKAQMKYADRRNAPAVIIQGGDERAKGEVTIKDLVEGAKAAAAIKGHQEWREARPAQVAVKEADMVSAVRSILARQTGA